MKIISKTAYVSIALLISGCSNANITDSDVLQYAAEPSYHIAPSGYVVATSCRLIRPSTYTALPSGCMRDTMLAGQVAYPAHLVWPVAPGPAGTYGIGSGANTYVYGNPYNPTSAYATSEDTARVVTPTP